MNNPSAPPSSSPSPKFATGATQPPQLQQRSQRLLVPQCGYCTVESRRDYIRMRAAAAAAALQDNGDNKKHEPSTSMVADPDIHQPLYFWQLYSLLGREPIYEILTNFYTRIYQDMKEENEWFRNAFTSNDSITWMTTTSSSNTSSIDGSNSNLQRHILAHASYWIDAMGGGPVFHGGEYRLSFHHKHHAAKVMNAQGAKRWMTHMKHALQYYDSSASNENSSNSDTTTTTTTRHRRLDDPRVIPCIMEFLKTKMKKYADQYGWVLDERDFEWEQDQQQQQEQGERRDGTQDQSTQTATSHNDNKSDMTLKS
jgi:truncated hemoglobin YjbI